MSKMASETKNQQTVIIWQRSPRYAESFALVGDSTKLTNQLFQFKSPEDVHCSHSYQNRNEIVITIFNQRANDSPQRAGNVSMH